ncbi:hypothetical protein ER308_18455 [Egibacter rhizosphaerae]|uniref:ABC transporter permease n=1 Tax=Egibacter rhizosphaerae TaxID=1670831 RepID=A0A411YJL8_9ACTN|nr:ABC transporter permease subunit [Egibacter rhizosphaerae]QBI21352.1 hypothetical protein ER308_18455 [Egibacter rhizosphaerae]
MSLDPVQRARIHDTGVQAWEGSRRGVVAAVWTLAVHTVQRLLGLRRPFRSKIVPLVVLITAYVPVLVFIGIAVVTPEELARLFVMEGPALLATLLAVTVLFVAVTGPETLCPDRRSGTLALYLASPLSPATYLAAKAAALGVVLLLVTTGPPLLVELGYVLLGLGPDGVGATVAGLVRPVIAGVVLSAFYTTLALAGSSLTDRRAYASVALAALMLGSNALVEIAIELLDVTPWLVLMALLDGPTELAHRIYGESGDAPQVPTGAVLAAVLAWIAAFGGLTWLRYRRGEVTR